MTTGVQPPATEDVVEPPATEDGEPPSTDDVVEERYSSDEVVYMRGVWGATKHIGDGLKMLAKELNQAPPEIRKKDGFRITCDTLRRAFRLEEKDFDPVESMTQSQTANYSAAEDWSESLKSLLDAADEMEILENKDDYPSFSLGFDSSQDYDACQPEAEPQPETDNTAHDEEDGEREDTADLGGCGLELIAVSDIGKELAVIEPVASAIARDVVSEHGAVDVAVCSAVEAVLELGDVAFETQTDTVDADAYCLQGEERVQHQCISAQHGLEKRGIVTNSFLRHPTCGRKKKILLTFVVLIKVTDVNNLWLKSMDHVIYVDDVVEVTKKKFSSLKPHEAVDAEVIDVWASYLNGMETYNVVERRASWEKSEAELTFCDEIDGQFNGAGRFDITHYDLTGVADVLDQVVPENGILDRAKYGRDLDLLVSILCELD
ncbi:hypothetical protein SASPL_111722 [Salvia splendens]|uniref:Uncharacterized protein n=1 Tax=Salvia splendens TaxID=180675 RepID=A0A8X8YBA1_SALSN|nr:hypothetical protein SASPL_111722 [Salvia splendens]